MTAYAAIADSEIDPESAGTTTLFTKLRDNPLAISEGDATAPEIDGSAITNGTIPYSALTFSDDIVAGDIATDAVTITEMQTTIGTYATTSLGTAGTFTTEGYYSMSCTTDDTSLEYQAYLNGSWVKMYDLTSAQSLQWIVSGSFRVWNSTGAFKTLTYQKFMG